MIKPAYDKSVAMLSDDYAIHSLYDHLTGIRYMDYAVLAII